uniref:Homing endonuclease LAGLIDADG domain-containing protein n=1 Tax=Dactylella sp. TaxID=1814903 RepID=A0A482DQS4_9PEZI|nr:hypothetical protein [Dactylella sp.]
MTTLGKLLKWVKLSNSGNFLTLLVLIHCFKNQGKWINNSCIVITQFILEKWKNYCGAKLVINTIKVQRENESCVNTLRHSLMGFNKNYLVKIPFNYIIKKVKWFSSMVTPQNLIIHPWFLTGFSDAEGCFTIAIVKRKDCKSGWAVKPKFQINFHERDKALIDNIHRSLGVGVVSTGGSNSQSTQLTVSSIKDLQIIIKHFDKYPLISQKLIDYQLFKEALNLILLKSHVTLEGLRKIVAIKASINKGLSNDLKIAFPGVKPVKRPEYKVDNIVIPDPQWFAGFTSGEGCLLVRVKNSTTHRLGFSVELVFQINQHTRDKQLLLNLVKYLNCGIVFKHSENAVVFKVTKFSDLNENIIPFFLKYPILGVKSKDFDDFCEIAGIMEKKGHLSLEGLDQIRQIKRRMNTGRDHEV